MAAGDTSATVARQLASHHLQILGHCATTPTDGLGDGTILLVGPKEPEFWAHFSVSPEITDTAPDPLDRWSQRVLTEIAQRTGSLALFPFGGPPYRPFQSWAERTGRFWASPIGFLVHDTGGLFASFRGALLLPETIAPAQAKDRPCDACAQPCRSACPVGAFENGYDVAACKAHLASPEGADCMNLGCRARRACPVGQGNRVAAQANFHMEAFR